MIQARSRYEIVPATSQHARAMATLLRAGDAAEMEAAGLGSHKALWRSYRRSMLARTGIVDGDLAAMWGLGGTPMGGVGRPWLMTTPAVERVPLSFVREARREVALMLVVYPRLLGVVDAAYTRAVRLLLLLGFEVGDAFPFGPHRALFRQYEMRRA